MMQLREKMALHGFESNDDYDYPLNCLMNGRFDGIRCLNIEGNSQRRKTAFASALAQSIDAVHIIYHDFSETSPPGPAVKLPPSKDEDGKEESPISSLDNCFAEACGYSEAETTVLILDQLQSADFREHIRLYRFMASGEWLLGGVAHQANKNHLLVFVISEEPLYHSLQKHSFRVWVGAVSNRQIPYLPKDFDLEEDAIPLLEALAEVFMMLEMSPTKSEYERIMEDLISRVRDRGALRCSIYGWMEGVGRETLYEKAMEPILDVVVDRLLQFLGCQEVLLGDILA